MLDENPKEISGRAFFISNGEPVRVWNFLNSILQAAGMQPVKKVAPKNLALFIAWLLENIHTIFRLKSEPIITRFAIHEMCTHHWFDISAAKEILGYSPQITFKKGMKILKDSFIEKSD